jgi:mono/diheme cytochrome c family protein
MRPRGSLAHRASLASVARAVALLAGVAGRDESEALREPDPSWSRMLTQPRVDPFDPSPVFADGKAMRRPPRGTIPHDAHDPGRATSPPPPVTRELVLLGRSRFETFCAACHGVLGDGRSVVAEKMMLRPPPSLATDPRVLARDEASIEAVIETGFGLMPSYADALSPRERWAVAAYVKALQRRAATPARELPPDLRAALAKEGP